MINLQDGRIMEFKDLKVLVIGTGVSGIAATELLVKAGAYVYLYDGNDKADPIAIKGKLKSLDNVSIIVGDLADKIKDNVELVVLSPGVPTDIPVVTEFVDRDIKVWGEIELAYAFSKGRIVGITGTNGKTTTTALTGQIMEEYFKSVFVVGNIGIPYTQMVTKTKDASVTVAELSSFQLETIKSFHPNVSMVLNITPDHLNRHYTMENYIDAKFNITMNQTKDDVCVLNYEDEVLRERGKKLGCKVVYFSSKRALDNGFYLDGDKILCKEGDQVIEIIDVNELQILGEHNYENVMAASAAAFAMGVSLEALQSALRKFKAVEHRIEFVAEKNGVKYYNDSKGTNPDAAIKAINAMRTKTVLIGGGYDKDSEFTEWINSFNGKVKKLVLIGQTAKKIADDAEKCGFKDYCFADSLEQAMDICKETAKPGECVLLSPACASWGMFKNFEERGRIFKDIVNAM